MPRVSTRKKTVHSSAVAKHKKSYRYQTTKKSCKRSAINHGITPSYQVYRIYAGRESEEIGNAIYTLSKYANQHD